MNSIVALYISAYISYYIIYQVYFGSYWVQLVTALNRITMLNTSDDVYSSTSKTSPFMTLLLLENHSIITVWYCFARAALYWARAGLKLLLLETASAVFKSTPYWYVLSLYANSSLFSSFTNPTYLKNPCPFSSTHSKQ